MTLYIQGINRDSAYATEVLESSRVVRGLWFLELGGRLVKAASRGSRRNELKVYNNDGVIDELTKAKEV